MYSVYKTLWGLDYFPQKEKRPVWDIFQFTGSKQECIEFIKNKT